LNNGKAIASSTIGYRDIVPERPFCTGTVIFFLANLASFTLYAQGGSEKIRLSGVVNAKTAVHSIHCFLKNHQHIGTVTDSLGYFNFSFPGELLEVTLVISSIWVPDKGNSLINLECGRRYELFLFGSTVHTTRSSHGGIKEG
jgi:hypothetical protein